tara:strand:+ start:384 stop:941 length:558 start_codon:yes stop_codon:yes gene_type:complete
MEENFFFWSERLNRIEDYSIARRTFDRASFSVNAAEDIWWNRTHHENTNPMELRKNPVIGDASITLDPAESAEYVLDWTVNVKLVAGAADAMFLRIVPFAAGQVLWAGADILQNEWPLNNSGVRTLKFTNTADPGGHSLNGRAYFTGTTARFDVGLVAAPSTGRYVWDEADFEVRSVQLVVRRPY